MFVDALIPLEIVARVFPMVLAFPMFVIEQKAASRIPIITSHANPSRRRSVRVALGRCRLGWLPSSKQLRSNPLPPWPKLGIVDLGFARRIKALPAPPLVVLMADHYDARLEAACEAARVDFWLEKCHLQARLLGFLQQRFTLKLTPTRLSS
jgi:hypothetical protein